MTSWQPTAFDDVNDVNDDVSSDVLSFVMLRLKWKMDGHDDIPSRDFRPNEFNADEIFLGLV